MNNYNSQQRFYIIFSAFIDFLDSKYKFTVDELVTLYTVAYELLYFKNAFDVLTKNDTDMHFNNEISIISQDFIHLNNSFSFDKTKTWYELLFES